MSTEYTPEPEFEAQKVINPDGSEVVTMVKKESKKQEVKETKSSKK